MKPLFKKGPSAILRVVLLSILSLALMMLDHRSGYLHYIRAYLAVAVYPIEYVVTFPVKTGQWLSANFGPRWTLIEQNAKLREENLSLRFMLQKFEDLKTENDRLRSLLDSATKITEDKVLVAEVLAMDLDPFTRKIKINKGSQHGVFEGQPVLDAQGVMGQVTRVSALSSVVMLVTDPNHALPVQVIRNGQRTIAVGMGAINRLALSYIPNNSANKGDIIIGDVLVTSGIGGQFPSGYPVGKVVEVNLDIGQPYAQVQAIPSASLERNREVLLVWTHLQPIDEKLDAPQPKPGEKHKIEAVPSKPTH
jgi:rod shape-determining protein MreC